MDDIVEWTCDWCKTENAEIRGKCRCKKCGEPRGSIPPWFKEFVESYRCRICKTDLTLDNFGGVGENHMIFCKDCK